MVVRRRFSRGSPQTQNSVAGVWGGLERLGVGSIDSKHMRDERAVSPRPIQFSQARPQPSNAALAKEPGPQNRARFTAETLRYPQVSYHSGPRPWDHSDTSLWASGSRYLNMALGPPGRGPGAGSARTRFCSPSIARRLKSDRMDPLVGAEGPAGVTGAVGGVPGGVQGGYHILTVRRTVRAGNGLIVRESCKMNECLKS